MPMIRNAQTAAQVSYKKRFLADVLRAEAAGQDLP